MDEQETDTGQKKPRTVDDVFEIMTETQAHAFEEDTFAAAEELNPKKKPAAENTEEKAPAMANDGPKPLPDFVTFPEGFRVPPNKEVAVMVFEAHWTDRPDKGKRWCLLWGLSDADEKLALKRTRGESARTIGELSKQTIRIIDAKRADWTKTLAGGYDVERFWDEIGPKCRQRIQDFYLKMHSLKKEELDFFFENCLFVRRAGG
jgi:hypothetical protein